MCYNGHADIKYLNYVKGVWFMPDYKKMYAKLFNKVTDVIEQLQQVQRETERMYIDSPEPELIVIEPKTDDDPEP
jgi:hypothetical protein